MRYTVAIAALCSIAAAAPSPAAAPEPVPQGVTSAVAPTDTPSSCVPTYESGDYFQIGLIAPGMRKRQVGPGVNPDLLPGNILLLSLQNGVLQDAQKRTGYIASNGQLQFDDPPQAGALYTAGFSACTNATLALESTEWFSCGSGGFSNLYTMSMGAQCKPINLGIYLYTGNTSSAIAGISAASTTGQLPAMASAMGVASGSATGSAAPMTTAGSGDSTMTGGMATSGMMATSGASSTGKGTTTKATMTGGGSMGTETTTAAAASPTGGNAAAANGVGKSLGGLAAMIGFAAFVL